jgi:hypothetical protein
MFTDRDLLHNKSVHPVNGIRYPIRTSALYVRMVCDDSQKIVSKVSKWRM